MKYNHIQSKKGNLFVVATLCKCDYLFMTFWMLNASVCLTGAGYVCNTYVGGSPYPMDIARIFNFGDEICKRYICL